MALTFCERPVVIRVASLCKNKDMSDCEVMRETGGIDVQAHVIVFFLAQ